MALWETSSFDAVIKLNMDIGQYMYMHKTDYTMMLNHLHASKCTVSVLHWITDEFSSSSSSNFYSAA